MANNKLIDRLTFYNKPLDSEAAKRVIANAERAAYNLEQQTINKTNMTDEMRKTINNNIQTNTTNDYPPTWKRLTKSFVAMMIVFLFVYTGFNILTWLYDTLGMEHVMPTLIGLVLWVVVYDHMYGTASKAPRI
jgi:hypothetical protein